VITLIFRIIYPYYDSQFDHISAKFLLPYKVTYSQVLGTRTRISLTGHYSDCYKVLFWELATLLPLLPGISLLHNLFSPQKCGMEAE
jgi:hypothetical protein